MSADLERDEGLGTRDGSEMNWEGEAPAEPKRRRIASGEWRIENSEQRLAISDWRLVRRRIANGFDHPPEVGGYEFKAG